MKRLIVVVPGIKGRKENWDPLMARLLQEPELAGSKWIFLHHGCDKPRALMRRVSAVALTQGLHTRIKAEWLENDGFDDIILIGHSMGGQLIRNAYLLGADAYQDGRDAHPWAERVSRIVLFASINRGIDPRRHLLMRTLTGLFQAVGLYPRMLASDLMNGSDFVTNLRIHWIRLMDRLGPKSPLVVQLLGDSAKTGDDGLVRRADSIDVEQFPHGHYIDVPGATHGDIHLFEKAEDPEGRYKLIRRALLHRNPSGKAAAEAESGELSPEAAEEKKIVFLLHGMHATPMGWVQKVGEQIRQRFPDVTVVKPDYGFVSALEFVIPPLRRRHIRWFQDQYSDLLAKYPRARFYFIGHSNGTYILGHSMGRVTGLRFERVYFAGCALPSNFKLQECFDRKQVATLRNDMSGSDTTIALLASGLSGVFHDVGTAGFHGFQEDPEGLMEVCYYRGGHGRPLQRDNIDNVLDYVFLGSKELPASKLIPEEKVPYLFQVLSRFAPVGLPVLILLILVGIFCLAWAGHPLAALIALVVAIILLHFV